MNALLYSCVVCRRSELPVLYSQSPGCAAVCFADEPLRYANRGWRVRELASRQNCPIRTARWHKLLPHLHSPGHDFYVWVDAHIVPRGNLTDLLSTLDADIGVYRHRWRTDPYQELRAVRRRGLESAAACDLAERMLLEENYPENGGLHETGILLLRDSARLREMLQHWWSCLERAQGTRDQLHFDRAVRHFGLKMRELAGTVDCNDAFDWNRHDHPASPETKRRQQAWTGMTPHAKS